PARFHESRLGEPRLLLARLVIGEIDAVTQLADADVCLAHLGDSGAAEPAKSRIARDVTQGEGNAHQDNEGEREKLPDRGGKEVADRGDHRAGNLSNGRRRRGWALL